jgi:pimeloyl-ACP methyl ester carboxylesterase
LLRKSDRGWLDAFIEDGGWGREWLARRKIVDGVEGLNAKPEEGWKERLKEGVVDTVAVETWERENHGGHVVSIVGMFRDGVFDQHEAYRALAKSEMKALVMIGSEDRVFEEKMMKRELESVGWKSGVRVVEGAGHGIVRSHVGEVAGVVEEFLSGKVSEN